MCLNVDKDVDAAIEKNLKKHGKIRMWKVFEVFRGKRSSLHSIYRRKEYKPGWNVSSARNKPYRRPKARTVSVGIHVFARSKDAGVYNVDYYNRVVLPVTCYAKDYIAGGYFNGDQSAVFAKVWLSKADYDSVC